MLVGVYLNKKRGAKMGCSGLVFHLDFKSFALLCYVLYITVPQPHGKHDFFWDLPIYPEEMKIPFSKLVDRHEFLLKRGKRKKRKKEKEIHCLN